VTADREFVDSFGRRFAGEPGGTIVHVTLSPADGGERRSYEFVRGSWFLTTGPIPPSEVEAGSILADLLTRASMVARGPAR
jgi:hypothetical protein